MKRILITALAVAALAGCGASETVHTGGMTTSPTAPSHIGGITTSPTAPSHLIYDWSNGGTVTTSHTVPKLRETWGPTRNVAP